MRPALRTRRAAPWRPRLAGVIVAGAVACAAGCSSKASSARQPPPELAGLAAVPASARVVIGAAPSRLADSALMQRGFRLLLERDADLAARVARLADGCGLDWRTQVSSIHLALTADAPQPLLVATGKLSEAELARCVQATVGVGGGKVTAKQVEGRTLYQVDDAGRSVTFAFGKADTVVVSASRELVVQALGTGKKALDDAALKGLIDRADTGAPLWAVGKVDPALGQRLIALTSGQVQAAPTAFLATLDPSGGLTASLGAVMAGESDAKALESHVNPTLGLIALAAGARGLGPLAAKIVASRDGAIVKFGVALGDAEVKDLLSKIDSRVPAQQDAPPAAAQDAGAAGD